MNPTLLDALEDLKNMTAMLTGLRRDLTENGWSDSAAEAIVFTLFTKMVGGAQ